MFPTAFDYLPLEVLGKRDPHFRDNTQREHPSDRLQLRSCYSLFSIPDRTHAAPQRCVIDTGAERSLLPYDVWSKSEIESKIRWLNLDAATNSYIEVDSSSNALIVKVNRVKVGEEPQVQGSPAVQPPPDAYLGFVDELWLYCHRDVTAAERKIAADVGISLISRTLLRAFVICMARPGSPPYPLIGLGGGAMSEGGVCVNVQTRSAHFVKSRRGSNA